MQIKIYTHIVSPLRNEHDIAHDTHHLGQYFIYIYIIIF
jgi:hypothetical protein